MGSTLTTFDALLKEDYIDSNRVEELVYPENVLLGMLEKRGDTGMVGDQMPVPLITANPQGVASPFATAQANVSNIVAKKFVITAGDYHGVVHIGDKVMMASRTNQGAFLENKVTEIDGLYETAGESLSTYCWGNGGNALGRIAAITSNTLQLAESADAMNFEIGMKVVASVADGATSTDALRDSGDSSAVTAVNRAIGTVDITVSDISGLVVGDYLFRAGDFFGDTGVIVIVGVQAFVTATDTPPTLWGVTNTVRATDPQRYAGCRVDPSLVAAKSYEQRVRLLVAQMTGRFKAKAPNALFMHPEDFEVLIDQLSARGKRELESEDTKFGYANVKITTASGKLTIYPDRHCPLGTAFAFRMENWWVFSMGELLRVQNGDGLQMLRRASSTDYEFRLISYPGLACNAPKNNGRVSLVA